MPWATLPPMSMMALGAKPQKFKEDMQTLYEYDSLGRLSKTGIANRIEITSFDFLNRVIEERVEDPSGNVYRKIAICI